MGTISYCMAVARGGGGLSPPPLWAGRSTLGDKFLRIISILRLEYTTFFKIFQGGMSPDPLDPLRTFGASMKRSALSESSPDLSQNLALALY